MRTGVGLGTLPHTGDSMATPWLVIRVRPGPSQAMLVRASNEGLRRCPFCLSCVADPCARMSTIATLVVATESSPAPSRRARLSFVMAPDTRGRGSGVAASTTLSTARQASALSSARDGESWPAEMHPGGDTRGPRHRALSTKGARAIMGLQRVAAKCCRRRGHAAVTSPSPSRCYGAIRGAVSVPFEGIATRSRQSSAVGGYRVQRPTTRML